MDEIQSFQFSGHLVKIFGKISPAKLEVAVQVEAFGTETDRKASDWRHLNQLAIGRQISLGDVQATRTDQPSTTIVDSKLALKPFAKCPVKVRVSISRQPLAIQVRIPETSRGRRQMSPGLGSVKRHDCTVLVTFVIYVITSNQLRYSNTACKARNFLNSIACVLSWGIPPTDVR